MTQSELNSPQSDKSWSGMPGRAWVRWLEWIVIVAGVTAFCWGILDLRSLTRLPGNEAEVFQALDWTLINSLRYYRAFPLWNPYIMSGIPYGGDPMLHVYNPLVTLPVLSLGVRAGFKLALYLSFLAGSFGMWRLGYVLGMGGASRVWMALMFAFAGQPTARFFQGQYLFVLGFAWIPWVISSLFQVVRFQRWRDIALSAIFLALIFFSGNTYFSFYMLIMTLLFGLIMLPAAKHSMPFFKLPWKPTWAYLAVGVLALGVIAIQLLPTTEFFPRVRKDMNLEGSHSLVQIFLDYTSKDIYRPDAYSVMPAKEELYAYIGLSPFLSLILLPVAFWKRDKRTLIYFCAILLFTVLWISIDHLPWRSMLTNLTLVLYFRHLLRILIMGSFAIIVLAGFGLDTLWAVFRGKLSSSGGEEKSGGTQKVISSTGLIVLVLFMTLGLLDVFDTNQQYLRTVPVYTPAFRVMSWVRENDLGDYYVRHNPNNSWQEATIANNLRYLDAWYHFADIRSLDEMVNLRPVTAQPLYLTQAQEETNPPESGAKMKALVENYNVIELSDSLPLAFVVSDEALLMGAEAGPLQRQDVAPILPHFSSTGHVDVIAEGHGNEMLVLLTTYYPGWTARMDGESIELFNVGGYLAVELPQGPHQFELIYQPRSFFWGLLISIIATGVIGWMLLHDLKLGRQGIRDNWRHRGEVVRDWQMKLKQRLQLRFPEHMQAVYKKGALYPSQALALEEETQVEITVLRDRSTLGNLARQWLWASGRLVRGVAGSIQLEHWLFGLTLLVYLLSRLWRLVDFPIYFFTDEAIQTVSAVNLLHNQLRSPEGILLPTYFQNGSYFNLSLSVYLQVLPTMLFGKSEFVTRAVSVFASLLGAGAVGLIMRNIFKVRYWWLGTLILSITPAWFLHSRTAFETVLFVSLYAVMLYAYLLYRYNKANYLYLAVLFAALAFYSYSPGQLIIVATWALFFLSDLPYHWKNRRLAIPVIGVILLLAVPYLRFRWQSNFDPQSHLSILGSYWIQPIPLGEKLGRFWQEYIKGLSPAYWFLPNEHDLSRHLMKGYGHISGVWLPFGILGFLVCLWKGRFSAYRNTIVVMFVSPIAASLVGIGITRVLVFVIPAVLMITLGLDLVLGWVEKLILKARKVTRLDQVFNILAVGITLGLCWVNIAMLRDALVNGPTWYDDYGLGGMQYGARQLFTAVEDFIEENPDQQVLVSPSWANGTDVIASFFMPEGMNVQMGSIEGYMYERMALDESMTFVMIPEELEKAVASGKFRNINVLRTLYYPNHQPGFLFVQLRYDEDIDTILMEERQKRKELQVDEVVIAGQDVSIRYSLLDIGTIQHIFDGDLNTVARTLEANPFIIELTFPEPTLLSGFTMTTGSSTVRVSAIVYHETEDEPYIYTEEFDGTVSEPGFTVNFGHNELVKMLRFEILEVGVIEPAHVHVWEIEIR